MGLFVTKQSVTGTLQQSNSKQYEQYVVQGTCLLEIQKNFKSI